MRRHQYTIKIIIIILTFSLSSCKIDTDIDDAARTIADSIENQADGHDNGSSSGSSSDYDSSNNYNGAIVLDSSQKGTDRFLMGTLDPANQTVTSSDIENVTFVVLKYI